MAEMIQIWESGRQIARVRAVVERTWRYDEGIKRPLEDCQLHPLATFVRVVDGIFGRTLRICPAKQQTVKT